MSNCPHCGKERVGAMQFTVAPINTSATTTSVTYSSTMGWNAIEPFLPPTMVTSPWQQFHPLTVNGDGCRCTLDTLDAKIVEVTAERDTYRAHLAMIRDQALTGLKRDVE